MKLTQKDKPQIVYKGRIFEVIKILMQKKDKIIEFEKVQRSPGTRLLIIKDNKILLTKEFRYELNDFDYRLPGGKVFDTLEKYNKALESNQDIQEAAKLAAIKECQEETGYIPKTIEHIHTSHSGATVNWDLYYFLIDEFETSSQQLEDGEIIEPVWKTKEEVKEMCLKKIIKEDRSVAVLLRFLL